METLTTLVTSHAPVAQTLANLSQLHADAPSPAGAVDTFGWDTVSAIRYSDVNKAIQKAGSSPKTFVVSQLTRRNSRLVLAGTFSDWQLAVSASATQGASGTEIKMSIPIPSLRFSELEPNASSPAGPQNPPDPAAPGGAPLPPPSANDIVYTGLTALIGFNLEFLNGAPGEQVLKPSLSGTPVSLWNLNLPDDCDFETAADIQSLLKRWLNDHLADFDHVFSTVDIAMQEDTGALGWIKPTWVSYSTSEPSGATLDDCVFGVMAMTEKRDPSQNSAQISAYAIPQGSRAGFLISRDRFLAKMLMPGIPAIFLGATVDNFKLSDDNTTITNTVALSLQDFSLPDGKTVTPDVPAGSFTIEIYNTYLRMAFDGLHYQYSPGIDVYITWEGTSKMVLDATNRIVKLQEIGSTTRSDVEMSNALHWAEVGMNIGLSIAAAAFGGALGKMAVAGKAIAGTAEGAIQGTADAVADGATQTADTVTTQSITTTVGDATTQAEADAAKAGEMADASEAKGEVEASAAGGLGRTARLVGWFSRNWQKVLGSMVGSMVGAGIGSAIAFIPTYLQMVAENEASSMPKLDDFAGTVVAPVKWPNSTAFKLDYAGLNNAMQLGGDPGFEK